MIKDKKEYNLEKITQLIKKYTNYTQKWPEWKKGISLLETSTKRDIFEEESGLSTHKKSKK